MLVEVLLELVAVEQAALGQQRVAPNQVLEVVLRLAVAREVQGAGLDVRVHHEPRGVGRSRDEPSMDVLHDAELHGAVDLCGHEVRP